MQMLADDNFDLVVLDLNLPGADGMTVLRTLRKTDRDTKVLILSARSEVSDKVDGLDAGANDYLAKPFHLEELTARIRSLTLRQLFSSASAMRTMFFCCHGKDFRECFEQFEKATIFDGMTIYDAESEIEKFFLAFAYICLASK